ncbi:MAG: T9SS type A sorting domain-containing protein [Bacteroidetes bacterium]|nr:T9SS type A sorting domain-containing protein [Bacteroidota bacterium]
MKKSILTQFLVLAGLTAIAQTTEKYLPDSIVEHKHLENGDSTWVKTIHFKRNDLGQIIEKWQGGDTLIYSYDEKDRLTAIWPSSAGRANFFRVDSHSYFENTHIETKWNFLYLPNIQNQDTFKLKERRSYGLKGSEDSILYFEGNRFDGLRLVDRRLYFKSGYRRDSAYRYSGGWPVSKHYYTYDNDGRLKTWKWDWNKNRHQYAYGYKGDTSIVRDEMMWYRNNPNGQWMRRDIFRENGNFKDSIFNILLITDSLGNIIGTNRKFRVERVRHLYQSEAVSYKSISSWDTLSKDWRTESSWVYHNSKYNALSTPTPSKQNTLKLYPNPATQLLNIESKEPIQQIVIYNIQGQELEHKTLNVTSTQLNISHLPKGTYLLQTITNQKTQTTKFIKQ